MAPFFMLSTAIGTLPWPVMKMTGRFMPFLESSSWSSVPVIAGMRTSMIMQAR
jgi:hypothetical protein